MACTDVENEELLVGVVLKSLLKVYLSILSVLVCGFVVEVVLAVAIVFDAELFQDCSHGVAVFLALLEIFHHLNELLFLGLPDLVEVDCCEIDRALEVWFEDFILYLLLESLWPCHWQVFSVLIINSGKSRYLLFEFWL